MNLVIYLVVLVLGILSILYGHRYNHGEMIMVGFATTFILGLTLSGVSGLFGGTGGIEFPSGEDHTYTYDVNATGQNDDIQSIEIVDTYTTYSSVFFGAWMAILSFFGFFGVLTGRQIFG